MSKKSPTKKIERLESIVMGMGFLLLRLKSDYGHDFSIGMAEQVNQALRDYRNVERSYMQRLAASKPEGS
jgi:hypothetical protein